MNEPRAKEVSSKRHILTVLLEDYFHVGAFNSLIQRGQWYRFETRFEQNTLKALDLLDKYDIKATFFVLGWIADRQPELVREVARRGHEIASRGYHHRSTREMTPAEFRADLRRARRSLERACGHEIVGYRAARKFNDSVDAWALEIVAEEGYAYDSSIAPSARAVRENPSRRFAHRLQFGEKSLWEFPLSTARLPFGALMPVGGGNYFRQFPHTIMRRAVADWHKRYDAPFVMYFHVWELDPVQPRIASAPLIQRARHYRNLDKMAWMLEDYFKRYSFTGIADFLRLEHAPLAAENSNALEAFKNRSVESIELKSETTKEKVALAASPAESKIENRKSKITKRAPVTVVIPCYNEELILPYLANTLRSVTETLSDAYDLNFIFVDDCSTDNTRDALRQLFGAQPNCTILRHKENRGVAAAIMTGVRAAQTEIVCSIDCDCTYDPHELRRMIPLLTEDVSLVTASPYHPRGAVLNVPQWRLALSKTSSFLYRQVLRQKLYTYTSCFRVYRRSALADLNLREGGFLGIAETLGRLDARGARFAEHPATLEVRLFGRSKMKVVKTIFGHLGLLARLLALRVRGEADAEKATAEKVERLEESSEAVYRNSLQTSRD